MTAPDPLPWCDRTHELLTDTGTPLHTATLTRIPAPAAGPGAAVSVALECGQDGAGRRGRTEVYLALTGAHTCPGLAIRPGEAEDLAEILDLTPNQLDALRAALRAAVALARSTPADPAHGVSGPGVDLERAAYDRGYAHGFDEGREAGAEETRERILATLRRYDQQEGEAGYTGVPGLPAEPARRRNTSQSRRRHRAFARGFRLGFRISHRVTATTTPGDVVQAMAQESAARRELLPDIDLAELARQALAEHQRGAEVTR